MGGLFIKIGNIKKNLWGRGSSPRELAIKGNECIQNGQYVKALNLFNQALEADPTEIIALCGKGSLHSLRDEKDDAIEYYRKALAIDPEYIPGLHKLAWQLNGKKSYEEAIFLCDEALRIEPQCAEAMNIKGFSLYKLGNYHEAIEAADQSKAIDPDISSIYRRLAEKKLKMLAKKEKISQFKAEISEKLSEFDQYKDTLQLAQDINKIERMLQKEELRDAEMDDIHSMINSFREKLRIKEEEEEKKRQEQEEAKRRSYDLLRKVEEEFERLRIKSVVFSEGTDQIEFYIEDGQYEEADKNSELLLENLTSAERLYEKAKEATGLIVSHSPAIRDMFASGKYSQLIEFAEKRNEIRTTIAHRLEDLETGEFSDDINAIYAKADDPSTIGEVENDLDEIMATITRSFDEKATIKSLKECQFYLERMNKDGIVLSEELKDRYNLISAKIDGGDYADTLKELHGLLADLRTCRETFEEARSLVDLFPSEEGIQLFRSGEYAKAIKLCGHLREQMDELISRARNVEEYYTLPDSVQKTIHENKFDEVAFALDYLKKLPYNAKPDLNAVLGKKEFRVNTSYHVPITVENEGLAHARNVKLSFSDEVTTKRVKPVPVVRGGESVDTDIAILPVIAGEVALDITLECTYGPDNRHYSTTMQLWIEALDTEITPHPRNEPEPAPPEPAPTPRPYMDLREEPEKELLANYTEVELIGRGGFAKVYRARKRNGSLIAIKIPLSRDTETGKAIMREINYWIDLRHNNIVRVYDSNIFPVPYFEMELCDASLNTMQIPIEPEKAAWIIYKICDGLKYAHNQVPPIIHRDLKPHNIMFKDGVPKITDWGMSKSLGVGSTSDSGHLKGTLVYSSPEQIDNSDVDTRTDIWQIGVIFYEMVTGRLPFNGENVTQITMSILRGNVSEPKFICPEASAVNDIIMKCLKRNKEKRYSSIEELQNDLIMYLNLSGGLNDEPKDDKPRNDYWSAENISRRMLKDLEQGNMKEALEDADHLLDCVKGKNKDIVEKLYGSLKYRIQNGISEPTEEFIDHVRSVLQKTILK